jgi:type I restriction enzyme M protein
MPAFSIRTGECPADVASRVRDLLIECGNDPRFSAVIENTFDGRPREPRIDLDDETITFVVDRLKDYSLSATGDLLHGADVKGVVFETMVGSTFRGSLGAYFTPRNVAEFMVRLLAPAPDDRVFDPSCGSGGFLIMVLKYLKDQLVGSDERLIPFAANNLQGFDIN